MYSGLWVLKEEDTAEDTEEDTRRDGHVSPSVPHELFSPGVLPPCTVHVCTRVYTLYTLITA